VLYIRKPHSLTIIAYSTLACFLCLGAIRLLSFNQPCPNDIRNFVTLERSLATIRGEIITEPYTQNYKNWQFAKFKFTDPSSSFYLEMSEVQTTTDWAKATGTIRVQVAEPALDLKTGDHIQAYCWLTRFNQPTNPGQFNIKQYLARKNIFVAAHISSRDAIQLLQNTPNTLTTLKRKLRKITTAALVGEIEPAEQTKGLLEALLLGQRADIDSDTYAAFRKTGLAHFISLSGLHLGILIGTIWWLCKIAGLLKPARAVICIIAISIFLLVVPPRAPTMRAAIIASIFCLSVIFRRYSNPLNTLSLAAIILLLIRPTNLFEPGWQLSFATVLGLLVFCEQFHFFLYEKIMGMRWHSNSPKTKPFFRLMSRPGPFLLRAFSTGITFWLGGAGILLYHFYTINPLAAIWTIIAFPLVAAILILGFFKIILFFLLPTLSAGLGLIVILFSNWLIALVKILAQLNFSQILIGHVSPAIIILYYCLIGFAALTFFRKPLLKRIFCAATILVILISLGFTKYQRTHHDSLTLTCLDVGHGQAILAQLPCNTNILFDAGSLSKSNVGGRVIVPFLNYSGINKIDSIIISHNDLDHINGLPEIVQQSNVTDVYANNAFFRKKDQWGTAKFLEDCLNEKNIEIKPTSQMPNLSGSAKIKFIWPDEKSVPTDNLSDNDSSLVTMIEFAGTKILLCSDIGKFAQQNLSQLYPRLKADIVIAPHHGSTNTLQAGFLDHLKPKTIISSCSRKQYKRLKNSPKIAANQFYTAKDNAIKITIQKDGTINKE